MAETIWLLACGCLTPEPTHMDKHSIRCMLHGPQSKVEKSAGWSWSCPTCPTGRRFGAARVSCLHGADKHQRKYPEHVVIVRKGTETVDVRAPARLVGQERLF